MRMKTKLSRRGWILAASALGPSLLTVPVSAAPFLYTPGDLILTLRQNGNAADYVVNVGRASTFSTLEPGTSLSITNFSSSQLSSAFSTLNDVRWSVAGANRPPLDSAFPAQTIWVTGPRTDPATPSTPWLRKGQFVQGNSASQIDGVGQNAALSSSLLPGGPDNTATGIILPVNAPFPIGPVIGEPANYVGAFQGNVETATPADFDAVATNVSRTDLYELLPGTTAAGTLNSPGRLLGSFELKADATLTFVAGSQAPTPPEITGIQHSSEVTTVSFTTLPSLNYVLRSTDAAGLTTPVSQWTAGQSLSGDGSTGSLQYTNSGPNRFFVVEVQP